MIMHVFGGGECYKKWWHQLFQWESKGVWGHLWRKSNKWHFQWIWRFGFVVHLTWHINDLHVDVQMIAKQQIEFLQLLTLLGCHQSRLCNHGFCWWATHLHCCLRQLVHEGQLLQHTPNPVRTVSCSFTLEITQHDNYFLLLVFWWLWTAVSL